VLLTSSVRDRMALHVETLLVSPYRLWLPLGHALAEQEAISLDQLAGEPLIQLMVDEIEESTARLMAALKVRPQIAFRTRSVEAVRSLVATGAGVAILPSLVYRPWSLEGDRIGIRDVSGDLPSVQVGLAWRKGAPLAAPALNFVRYGTECDYAPRRGIGFTDIFFLRFDIAKIAPPPQFVSNNRKIGSPGIGRAL